MIPSSIRIAVFSRTGDPVPSNSRAPVSQSRSWAAAGAAISAGNLCVKCLPPPAASDKRPPIFSSCTGRRLPDFSPC
jgi:hypothetical protein